MGLDLAKLQEIEQPVERHREQRTDGHHSCTPLDLDRHHDMATVRDHGSSTSRQGRARHGLGISASLGRDPGNMEERSNMDQESGEDHRGHGVEEDGRRLFLRDQAKRRKLPADLTSSQSDSGDGDGKTPADGVQEPVLLGEPCRVPDSVQMQVDNQSRAPRAS